MLDLELRCLTRYVSMFEQSANFVRSPLEIKSPTPKCPEDLSLQPTTTTLMFGDYLFTFEDDV